MCLHSSSPTSKPSRKPTLPLPSLQHQSFLPPPFPPPSASIIFLSFFPPPSTRRRKQIFSPAPSIFPPPAPNHPPLHLHLDPNRLLPLPSSAGAVNSIPLCPDSTRLFTVRQHSCIHVYSKTSHLLLLPPSPPLWPPLSPPPPIQQVSVCRHRNISESSPPTLSPPSSSSPAFCSPSPGTRPSTGLKAQHLSDLRYLESLSTHDAAVNAFVEATEGTIFPSFSNRRICTYTRPPEAK